MTSEPPLSGGTRIRLLEAGLLCFAARGYAAAGIREIAAGAGVNISLVNYHFGGKAGLYQEVLRTILSRKGARLSELTGQQPAEPGLGRPEAVRKFGEYIRMFLEVVLPTTPLGPLDDAARTILGRELEAPTPQFAALLGEFIRPIAMHLDRLILALRPDLDEAARFAMGLSIQGQMVHLCNALGVIRLLRGDPAWPRDLGALTRHFTEFSLRGLGLAEVLDDPGQAFLAAT